MAEGKKSFVLYTDLIDVVNEMENEQAGRFFKLILNYVNDNNPVPDSDLKLVFIPIKQNLKRDLQKYESKKESIKKAREKNPNNNKELQTENKLKTVSNQSENSSVNVNDTVNVNVNVNELSKDNNNNSIVSKDTRSNEYDLNTAFEYFWGLYPKKVGKQKCMNWFKTHHPKRDLVAKMCEAVKNQSKSEQWTKDDGKYIPMCYTWLNRGGWDDILEKEMPKSEFDINGGFEEL